MQYPSATAELEAQMEAILPAPRLRRIAILAVLVLVGGFGGLLLWSAVTRLDSAVVSTGTLVSEGRRKTVTLLEAGILRELLVREGERVAAGQPLLRMDTTQAEAAAAQARTQFHAQSARAARLAAEQSDERRFAVPEDVQLAGMSDRAVAALLTAEQRLFEARWAAFDGAVSAQRTRIAQAQEQMRASAAQRGAILTRLRATREELSGTDRLVGQGFATRTRLWELQRMEAELAGLLSQAMGQEATFREQIAQAETELANLLLQRRQEVARELQDALSLAADAEQRLRSAADVLRRREVTAPEDGTVTDIRFFTAGSSITAGAPVLDLVPLDDKLVAETRVAPTDIEGVYVGQNARVRLAAFRTAEVSLIEGRVVYVSADQRTDERGNGFFTARVALDPDALARYPTVAPAPGMPVEAFILGQARTALDYLLRPLADALRRAMRD